MSILYGNNMTIYIVAYFNWWSIVFCSLVAVKLATAFQYEFFIESESESESNVRCHSSIKDQYWKLIQWFYGVVNIVFVNLIIDTNPKTVPFQQLDTLAKGISKQCNCAIQFNVLNVTFEPEFVSYVDTFTWQGERFNRRPMETTIKIVNNRKKRNVPHNNNALKSIANENCALRGENEIHFGVLCVVENISILGKYLVGPARTPFQYPRRMYVIIIRNSNEPHFEKDVASVLQKLWLDYGIANAILITPCAGGSEIVRTYFPYEPIHDGNSTAWGALKTYNLTDFDFNNNEMFGKFKNLNNYPLRISLFRRYPTSLKANELPAVFNGSYLMKDSWRANGYGGVDGIMLSNVAKTLNFRPIVVEPLGIDFGFKSTNGTFLGTMGAVLYRNTVASFNGRFVKDYGTDEIEHMFPYFFDKLCIVAPKALKIPQWMAIFKCFSITVWIWLLIVNCICGWFWFLLKRSRAQFLSRIKTLKKQHNDRISNDKFSISFIEMWIIMLSGPCNQLPAGTMERIFLATCLFSSIIFSGSFQGSLYTSYSTVTYYKDINTLAELDERGLSIGTSSGSLAGIFGQNNSGGPVIRSLAGKYFFSNATMPTIERTAYKRDICCVERWTDIAVIIADQYEKPDGSVLLHVIKECPQSFYVSFIVKKGYPLLPTFDNYIRRAFEAGIIDLWYNHVEYAIITHKRYNRTSISDEAEAFTMVDMQTAFYILFIGLSISTAIFIAELIVHRRKQREIAQYFEFVN